MMAELEALRQLVTFAACGTLSAAAEQLHISQPSLSRSMQKLEDDLDVILFDRTKNRLTLNETGRIAVSYARKVLDEEQLMRSSVQLFDRRQHTISIGSVAPAPLWDLPSLCSSVYPEMSVSTELKDNATVLLQGMLARHDYQLIILPFLLEDERCVSFLYFRENLMLYVPRAHPLSRRKSVHFSDFNGETMVVHSRIGFWDEIHRRNLPDSHFVYQERGEDVDELVTHSDLPAFVTDQSLARHRITDARVAVPIVDDDAHASFYICCLRQTAARLSPLLRRLRTAAAVQQEKYE